MGGQSSRATWQLLLRSSASGGKRTKKKDLGMMMMSYSVYVAQVAMEVADKESARKHNDWSLVYHGPSVIIIILPVH